MSFAGVARYELATRSLSSFILPEDQDLYHKNCKKLFATADPQEYEVRRIRKDAASSRVRYEARTTRDASGATVCQAVLIAFSGRVKAHDEPRHVKETLRYMAEARLQEQAADQAVLSAVAAGNLPHELRVHQIELEMQNEELRWAQGELEASQSRYFYLYELAPVGFFTLNEQGLILEANFTAATLYRHLASDGSLWTDGMKLLAGKDVDRVELPFQSSMLDVDMAMVHHQPGSAGYQRTTKRGNALKWFSPAFKE